jgi:hypothetical protein
MNPLRPRPTKQNLHQLTGHKWQPALLRLILSDTILGDRPDAMIEGGVFRADRARGVSAGRQNGSGWRQLAALPHAARFSYRMERYLGRASARLTSEKDGDHYSLA